MKKSEDNHMDRRAFLRKAGITGAAAAAFIGAADVIGLGPASAATQRSRSRPQSRSSQPEPGASCTYTPCSCKGDGHAGSNGCCDSGYCCYFCRSAECGDFSTCVFRGSSGCPSGITLSCS
jgi:hypothetical protein